MVEFSEKKTNNGLEHWRSIFFFVVTDDICECHEDDVYAWKSEKDLNSVTWSFVLESFIWIIYND